MLFRSNEVHDIEDTPGSWVPKNVFQLELLATLQVQGEEEEEEEGEVLLWVKEEVKEKVEEELELELDLHKSHHCHYCLSALDRLQ